MVTVIGPRQSGKTTPVREQFPEHAYVNLEDPQLRALARDDAKAFLQLENQPGFERFLKLPAGRGLRPA